MRLRRRHFLQLAAGALVLPGFSIRPWHKRIRHDPCACLSPLPLADWPIRWLA
jgi:hypothetical protein